MIKLLKEDAFTDAVTTNSTWQLINDICKGYGYKFNPYARVEIRKNGRKVLSDITIWSEDDEMPDVKINTKTTPLTFEITTSGYRWKGNLKEFEKFLEVQEDVIKLCKELESIDLYDLYQHYTNE